MLNVVRGFSRSNQNGLFINSCFAHCQSERPDTWFADNSPVIGNKVTVTYPYAVLVKILTLNLQYSYSVMQQWRFYNIV